MSIRQKDILVTLILLGLLIIGFFLPVLDFSFGLTLSGFEAFMMQMISTYSAETYADYLWKALLLVTPILDIVMIFWLLRKPINLVPLILVSSLLLISSGSWILRYGELGILRIGYYYWLILNLLIIVLNFMIRKRKLKNTDQ